MLKRTKIIMDQCITVGFGTSYVLLVERRLTEDSSHRQDEQLQQCVLFFVGQTQEAQFGHLGEVRNSSPFYLLEDDISKCRHKEEDCRCSRIIILGPSSLSYLVDVLQYATRYRII